MYETWKGVRRGGRAAPGARHLIEGAVTVLAGLALWLFTGDVETPVITLRKVGVTVMLVGVVQILIGAWAAVSARGRR